jgi:D-arabinose 1-dehydrogenase-like Zn-dependent alcohol dehydrogenase
MKAVTLHDYGTPDVLGIEDVPVPKLGPGQILIKVEAARVEIQTRYIYIGSQAMSQAFAPVLACHRGGGIINVLSVLRLINLLVHPYVV